VSANQLKSEILEEIELNLSGSHLSRSEKQYLEQYRSLINSSSPDEIIEQRDYLNTMRAIRLASQGGNQE